MRIRMIAIALLGLSMCAGCQPPQLNIGGEGDRSSSTSAVQAITRPSEAPGTVAGDDTAAAELTRLPVKGRAPMTGYSREQFGPAWTDDVAAPGGHNGCDTRNDILRRDLTAITLKPGSHGCTVLTGQLADPYTGRSIAFQRGSSTSAAVQIDHVVSLGDTWSTGAQALTSALRQDLANDPLNLSAVDGPSNVQKSDSDAASWLPANRGDRCTYVARQISVKLKYRLWVTSAEHAAMVRVLATCPRQKTPTESDPDVAVPAPQR